MQPSVPTSSSWRRCPCLSIDMARKLAVFGLVFALTELSAAYLPLSALWLAAAIFVAAGIWPSIRRESVRVIAVPLMAAVVLGLGCSTLYRWFVVRPAEALSGRTAEIVATVQTDAQTSYREEMLSATLHITEMDGEPADLYASCGAFPGARAGEIFSARVSLEALEEDAYRMNRYADGVYLNAEYLDGYEYLGESNTLKFLLYRLRMELSRRLRTYLPSEAAGLEAAMLLGDKTRLEDGVEKSFRVAGVSHLLAVSGLHVTLLCGLLVSEWDIRRRFSRPRIVMQAALLVFYMALIGFPVSAVRAGSVFLITLLGRFLLQPPDTLTSMGLVALVLGIQNAYAPCDLGFQLSFGAVLGVQAASAITRWEGKTIFPWPETERGEKLRYLGLGILSTLQSTILATLATLPVLLAHGMSASGVSVLTNLLVVWMLRPALILGIAVVALSVLPFLAPCMKAFSLLLAVWLNVMYSIVQWCAALPTAHLALPEKYTLLVLAVLGLLAVLYWKLHRMVWYLPAALICCAAAVALGVVFGKDVVRIGVVGTAGNGCLVVTQNGRSAVLFRGGDSNLRAVEEYLEEAGDLPQTVLVDLRQNAREIEFEAARVVSMEDMEEGVEILPFSDEVTLELWHTGDGNLAVVEISGYTVGIQSGKIDAEVTVGLDVYCAGASYPDNLDADTVIYTSRAASWLEKAENAALLYGPDIPELTIRPGRSVVFDGVTKDAVQ